ncbi:hypothetical protein IX53_03915 [Kosmotoga pacifica]|uniref:RNA-binding S4 domain-containing protein n=2 Tax=Kosmotoga pacifica TaxID=1330330 RepID=A0A0G2Z9K3_9BACT|nr:hypothetical protein IX53_03915 [Kosmotoga pacifica]
MRLDKFISRYGGISRRESKKLIRAGKVKVNDIIVRNDDLKISVGDKVFLDGKELQPFGYVYIVLYKPVGYVSSRSSVDGESVFKFIMAPFNKELSIAGRLDKDAEGMLLLSNDGDFVHSVISPKNRIEKEYIVKVRDRIEEKFIKKMKEPVVLKDGEILKAEHVENIGDDRLLIVLTEGKYHEIKRMVKACGNEVMRIKRIRVGGFRLPDELLPGEWRELKGFEIKKITGVSPR